MKEMMRYKGYYGSVNFDPDEPTFYGKLEFIKALVSYESDTALGIKQAFENSVDEYLCLCEAEGSEAEKPFKGSFNIRTGQKLHEKIAMYAQKEEISINKFICNVLEKECHQRRGST